MTAASRVDPTPETLRTLATRFDVEIGGVYGYIAGALRQQAADREGGTDGSQEDRAGH